MTKLRFGHYTVELSRPGKILFPDHNISKRDLIDYYRAVAPLMLPHLRDRPLMMRRFPDGIDQEGFYQKQIGDYFPGWIASCRIKKISETGEQTLVICNNIASVAYIVNQATITPHLWLSRCDRVDYPDRLIFDLDPPGNDFGMVRRAALRCRELCHELELPAYVMTTGSKGLHVLVPLKRHWNFDRIRDFARDFATLLARRHPRELTVEQRKDRRGRRLYLDIARNAYAQTSVAPYAVRARPGAPVATPVTWAELEDSSLGPRSFDLHSIRPRLQKKWDPWHNLGRHGHRLERPERKLARLLGKK